MAFGADYLKGAVCFVVQPFFTNIRTVTRMALLNNLMMNKKAFTWHSSYIIDISPNSNLGHYFYATLLNCYKTLEKVACLTIKKIFTAHVSYR